MINIRNISFNYKKRIGFLRFIDISVLKKISLKIENGEKIGLIGRNGSGKSTLLKIINKFYKASTGEVKTNGSISYVTLNPGFIKQLNGEKNTTLACVYNNFKKNEITKIIKKCKEFSELDNKFFEPVETYSNGMKSRLAFSIAKEINSDILLIDEALSVGDIKFQKKSEQFISELANSKKTIIMASHSEGQLRKICKRGVVIQGGKIVFDGNINDALDFYNKQ